MNWKNKRVFVSGGAGVIGKELVNKLVIKGANVFVGDLKPFTNELPKNINYRQGDLNYLEPNEFNSFEPQYFFHLAATFERSTETYEFWEENFWNNVKLSNYLMTIAKDSTTLKKVIFASSYLIYNPELYQFKKPQQVPFSLKETDPIYPRNLTGVAKLSHEIELRFLEDFRREQFKIICARIYRGYGKGSRDVISRWIRDLLNNKEILVYKKEGIFDYIFSEDTAEGLIQLAQTENTEGIYNLGTGKSRKVEDIVKILKHYFPMMSYKEVESDILFEASQACMDKYYEATNWLPKNTLETAIPKMIEYEKKIQHTQGNLSIGNILVTSVSKKVSLIKDAQYAAKKLNSNIILIGNDINENCIAQHFVDKFWHSKKLSEYSFDELCSELRSKGISFVIPTRDGELSYWAKNKKELARKNIYVMVSPSETIDICLDKLEFYKFSKKNNIPAIITSENIEEIPGNKYVVKERYGAGSIGIKLNIEKEEANEFSKQIKFPVFQPFINGHEYSFDAYIDNKNNIKGIVIRARNVIINGESQITSTIQNLELEDKLKEVISKFHFYGHIVGQMIINEDNEVKIIEINPRFGGASSLSVKAGLDSFYWFLLESLGNNLSDYKFLPLSKSLKLIRFPSDKFVTNDTCF